MLSTPSVRLVPHWVKLTFVSGQQPYVSPLLQHVSGLGHVTDDSLHLFLPTESVLSCCTRLLAVLAGVLVDHGIVTAFPSVDKHLPALTSHLVPCGQQCCPSEQHTAYKIYYKVQEKTNPGIIISTQPLQKPHLPPSPHTVLIFTVYHLQNSETNKIFS